MLVNSLHVAHVLDGEKAKCLAAGPEDIAAYSFDFFILRPKCLHTNVFDAYKDQGMIARLVAEGRDFPEMMLHDAIKQSGAFSLTPNTRSLVQLTLHPPPWLKLLYAPVNWILSERETVVELPWAADSCPCVVEAANRYH